MACMNLNMWVTTAGLYGLPPPALANYEDEPSKFAPPAWKLQAVSRATRLQKALHPFRMLLGPPADLFVHVHPDGDVPMA